VNTLSAKADSFFEHPTYWRVCAQLARSRPGALKNIPSGVLLTLQSDISTFVQQPDDLIGAAPNKLNAPDAFTGSNRGLMRLDATMYEIPKLSDQKGRSVQLQKRKIRFNSVALQESKMAVSVNDSSPKIPVQLQFADAGGMALVFHYAKSGKVIYDPFRFYGKTNSGARIVAIEYSGLHLYDCVSRAEKAPQFIKVSNILCRKIARKLIAIGPNASVSHQKTNPICRLGSNNAEGLLMKRQPSLAIRIIPNGNASPFQQSTDSDATNSKTPPKDFRTDSSRVKKRDFFYLVSRKLVHALRRFKHDPKFTLLVSISPKAEFIGAEHPSFPLLAFNVFANRGLTDVTNAAGVVTPGPKRREPAAQEAEFLSQDAAGVTFEPIGDLRDRNVGSDSINK
jgi:hypothetical protein